ncbi:hypothetical protein JCM11491_005915 [Sporobolomyces phaffii]
MTRRIPLGRQRIRQYKSCVGCRQVKGRCEGLDEDYLKRLDDEAYVHPGPPPRCVRCERRGEDCVFDPSRRNGRPRRLADSASPSPYPPSSTSRSTRSTSLTPAASSAPPSPPPFEPTEPSSPAPPQAQWIEWIASGYLACVFVWNPLLPPALGPLHWALATCDPLLLAAINCTVDPRLGPAPAFPPAPTTSRAVSLSLLQAAALFAARAFGVGDPAQASTIVRWAMTVLGRLGWNGDDGSKWAEMVDPKERAALVACGWHFFSLSTLLGVVTGDRTLFVTVELPTEVSLGSAPVKSFKTDRNSGNQVTPRNMFHHALALVRDATNYEYMASLDPVDQSAYTDWIIGRSETVSRCALGYLDLTSPSSDPAPAATDSSPPALVLAAARESAFATAIVSACAIILVLSRAPPPPPPSPTSLLSNVLPSHVAGSASTPPRPGPGAASDSTSASIARATHQVVSVCRTTRDARGALVALQAHSPCLLPFILVTANGIVSQRPPSPDQMRGGGGGGQQGATRLDVATIAAREVAADLDVCDVVLAHQLKWPYADRCRAELAAMRTALSPRVGPPSL